MRVVTAQLGNGEGSLAAQHGHNRGKPLETYKWGMEDRLQCYTGTAGTGFFFT